MNIEAYTGTSTNKTIYDLKKQFNSLLNGGLEKLGETVLTDNKETDNLPLSKKIEANEQRLSSGIIEQIQQLRDGFTNTFDGNKSTRNNIVKFSKRKPANTLKS